MLATTVEESIAWWEIISAGKWDELITEVNIEFTAAPSHYLKPALNDNNNFTSHYQT